MRKKALNMCKLLYGNKVHREVVISYNDLGLFYSTQSKYELADIANSYNNLSDLYDVLADYKNAEVFYNKSLAINKQILVNFLVIIIIRESFIEKNKSSNILNIT